MRKIYALLLLSGLVNSIDAQTTCRSAYDSNFNNDYQGTSYFPGPMTVPLNTDISGAIEASNDVDYYKFYITGSGTIKLSLMNLPANYNLRLVNSLGYSIATSANTGNTNEVITYPVTGGNYYYALVYPSSKRTFTANACYVLRVTTITASKIVDHDGDADLQNPSIFTLYPNPSFGSVNLDLKGFDGDIHLTMMNILGERVYDQQFNQENIRLDLSALESGLYIVDVIGPEGLIGRQKLILK